MKKYEVLVEETLSRMIEVDAVNETEAEDKVKEMYDNCEIVLDAEDFEKVSIEVWNEIETK